MMTDVVPSPTSSSWVRLNSIIDCIHSNKRNRVIKFHNKEKLSLRLTEVMLSQDIAWSAVQYIAVCITYV